MIKFILHLVILAILLCCSKIEEPVSDRDYAIDLLNKRQYAEAITIFKKLLEKNANDYELDILLASAYSGSVGLNLIDAFEAFKPILFKPEEKSKMPSISLSMAEDNNSNAMDKRVKEFEKTTLKLLDNLANGFRVVNKMPHTPDEQRANLVEAIFITSKVPENSQLYLRAKSYSALINAMQFLNYIRDAYPNVIPNDEESLSGRTILCALNIDKFLKNINTSAKYLSNSLSDLEIAYKASDRKFFSQLIVIKESALKISSLYNEDKDFISAADLSFSAFKSTYCD